MVYYDNLTYGKWKRGVMLCKKILEKGKYRNLIRSLENALNTSKEGTGIPDGVPPQDSRDERGLVVMPSNEDPHLDNEIRGKFCVFKKDQYKNCLFIGSKNKVNNVALEEWDEMTEYCGAFSQHLDNENKVELMVSKHVSLYFVRTVMNLTSFEESVESLGVPWSPFLRSSSHNEGRGVHVHIYQTDP